MTDLPTQKRRFLWPVISIALLVSLAAYPIYWFTLRGGTPPERIFVAVQGEPPVFATELRDAVAHELTDIGFVVMGSEADEAAIATDLDWDRAIAAADSAGARYLVHIDVTRDSDRAGLTDATHFAVATASGRVGPVDPDEDVTETGDATSLAGLRTGPWTFGTEGADIDEAMTAMVPSFATVFRHWAAGALMTMPALVARLEDPEHLGDAERTNALDDALQRKTGQLRSLARYEEVCVESIVQATIDDERGPEAFTCVDPGCGESYLFGLSADGSEALMHVESPTAYVPFATSPAPRGAGTLQRLELVPLEGGEPRVLAVAESFFGYGSMSRDGSRVTFVEQASRRFGVIALDVESGERRVLSVIERPGLVLQARISPDGHWVAFHQKAFSRAHTELHVMPFDGGPALIVSRRTRIGRWVEAPLVAGEAPRQLVAFDGADGYEGSPRPALVDPADPLGVVELDVGQHVVRQVIGAHEGALVLLGSERSDIDRCQLGIRDATTLEIEWRDLGACIQDARLSDRGEVVGAAVLSREGDPEDADPEAIVMNLETGDTTIHTINRARERYVRAAGNRLVFERTIRSQFPSVHPNAVCWTTR